MSLIPTTPFFFFRTPNNSQNTKLTSSSIPPYSKRALVAVIVVLPIAFGLNIPLNSMVSFMPIWGVIMINAIVIASYMTFFIPKASILLSSWLNSKNGVN